MFTLNVLDNLYADIQKLRGCSCSCSDGVIDDVEDILDKYRAEVKGRIIVVETNDDFESCDDCIHSDDAEVICKMRGCIHAILDDDIKECYIQKEREAKYE